MSSFLRDEYLRNITVSESVLRKINDDLIGIFEQEYKTLLEKHLNQEELIDRVLRPSYIIRFDGKGFQLSEFEKAIKHFQDAEKVERFIFTIQSIKHIKSSGREGKSIELFLDANDINNCKIIVQADDGIWVDAVFYKIKERINKYKNKNFVARNKYIALLIQLAGVMIGFLLSLCVAIKIAPKLAIDNAFAFSFIIVFLMFSNIWTIVFEFIIRLLNYWFPNVSFKSKKTIHWAIMTLSGSVLVSITYFGITKVLSYLSEVLKPIFK